MMKKIVSLLLCLAMTVLVLVSCGEEEIGSYRKNYTYEAPTVEEVTLNMYIVGDKRNDGVVAVSRMINQYTESTFKTTLNIHYLSETTYRTDVLAAMATGESVDILLVNSATMMDELMAGEKLLDLTDYYASKEYGMLNTKITSLLLNASKYDGKYYSVPNNRMTGSYDYLLMNEAIGEKYNYGPLRMSAYTSYEDTADLRAAIVAGEGISEDAISDYVRVVNGTYADRFAYEEQGYICNVIAYHTPTREDVYNGSAFAIGATCEKPARAMEIIYAINQDATLRNLLQYGVANVNYTLDGDTVTRITSAGNCYYMNPYYTGNIFNAYYSADDTDGWNTEIAKYAKVQNDDIETYIKHHPMQ